MNTSDELAKRIKLFELAFEKYNKVSEQLGGVDNPDEDQKRNIENAFNALRAEVLAVEELRRKLDEEIGLNRAQGIVHDLTLHLDTGSEGQISFSSLNNATENYSKLITTLKPSFDEIAELRLVGIGTGSTRLYADICVADKEDEPAARNSMAAVSSAILDTQKMVNDTSQSAKAKINSFAVKNNISTERAVEVVKLVNDMSNKTKGLIEVGTSTPGKVAQPITIGDDFSRKRMERFKGEVKDAFKEQEPLEVSGQMRMAENWDSTHKFKIHDKENGRDYMINFNPDTFSKEEVSSYLGEDVTIVRMKVGRQWFLKEFM